MASVKVTVNGLSSVIGKAALTSVQLLTKVDNAVQAAGIECQKQAKIACPVDTGRLRNSILYNNIGNYSCTVGTNVNYAWYQEFGTKFQPAQPFLYPAYELGKQKMMSMLGKIS